MKNLLLILAFLPIGFSYASKLVEVSPLDNRIIMLRFLDGEVIRRDDGTGNCAFMGGCHNADGSRAVYYGQALDTASIADASSWKVRQAKGNWPLAEARPEAVYRKTKLNGMSISHWDSKAGVNGDYVYDTTLEHHIYLKMPNTLEQGVEYTVSVNPAANSDALSVSFTFDFLSSRSEAIHINLWGYSSYNSIKSADLYHWMGDGGARDYSAYNGNNIFLYNTLTNEKHLVGKVAFWQKGQVELGRYDFIGSDVWNIDFTGFDTPGTYRLAVDGVGCSPEFGIAPDIYREPFRVSTLGYFYMRLGQDSPGINPRPREPLFIPGADGTEVYISELQPYHPNWDEIRQRVTDPWDHPNEFEPYSTGRTNHNAWGGVSDAYDWDKRLQHVSIIYDMLLPYILTKGVLSDDDIGIAESGNGIPDILDEARNEVDAWLRLRDGKGYAHGLSGPYNTKRKVKFQSGNTAVAAWANALNCAMLAEAFHISGNHELRKEYTDSSLAAFNYAKGLTNPMLDLSEGDGTGRIRGRDFMMMAAAFLYNLTGNNEFETIMANEWLKLGEEPSIVSNRHSQLFGVAAYLTSNRKINYPVVSKSMKTALIGEVKKKEAGLSAIRPSRRATCNDAGYFWTIQNVQRTILAHAISDNTDDRALLLDALILEADWGLGRNPANIIQMTTASTPMAVKRSAEAVYTSGYNDGTPGLHPGHTPYWNMHDWAPNLIMGRPSWLATHGHPAQHNWPVAELIFNTDYVWAHTEFTPQQTLRGKNALYGYLYGVLKFYQTQ